MSKKQDRARKRPKIEKYGELPYWILKVSIEEVKELNKKDRRKSNG